MHVRRERPFAAGGFADEQHEGQGPGGAVVGMAQPQRRARGLDQRGAAGGQRVDAAVARIETDAPGLHERIEHAPVDEVEADAAVPGQVHPSVPAGHEGRGRPVADPVRPVPAALRPQGEGPGRALEHDRSPPIHGRQQARLQQHGRGAHGVRAGEGRVSHRLHDQEATVGARIDRGHDQVGRHGRLAVRRVQQQPAQPVGAAAQPAHALDHGRARRRRDPAHDHPADIAAGLGVYHVDGVARAAPYRSPSRRNRHASRRSSVEVLREELLHALPGLAIGLGIVSQRQAEAVAELVRGGVGE